MSFFCDFLNKDKLRRDLITEVGGLKSRRNKVSQEIPKLKKEGKMFPLSVLI